MLNFTMLADLGHTRAARHLTHLLQTPDTFVRIPLPGLLSGNAIVHAAPALGAAFLAYTAEIAPGGKLLPGSDQRFVYVLEGEAHISGRSLDQSVSPGNFIFLSAEDSATCTAIAALRCFVLEKPYEALAGIPAPTAFTGC